MLSLGDKVLQKVCDSTSPPEVWEKLEALYMAKSLTNRLYLKQHMYHLRMEPDTSMSDHIDRLNHVMLDLINIGEKIKDEDRDVKALLNSRELKKKVHDGQSSDSDGLLARSRSTGNKSGGRGKSRSKFRGRKVTCWHCKEEFHLRQNCPKWKGKKKNDEGMASAGVVVKSSDEASYDVLAAIKFPKPNVTMSAAVLLMTSNNSGTSWILDSRCSYHMCYNRELFATYHSIEGGRVLMGNNDASKVINIGTVQVKNI
ncbi:hypothetical protein CRG98_020181 [Punica granatum]|uniref:Retrovirus-related Pol polyprotein from transposon TNT 1-94-like beta-barrel domain-containing protein n=1 Tax=Punica granatum TaxID=22663 RepID=A0A2I0JT28_PUNGR|nr:hypothetical protein CRG98_020181 [Punica granatum]